VTTCHVLESFTLKTALGSFVFRGTEALVISMLVDATAAERDAAEARGFARGLTAAMNICGSHYRGYKLSAEDSDRGEFLPLPHDYMADAVMVVEDACRALLVKP
jgi:hypothetical protein